MNIKKLLLPAALALLTTMGGSALAATYTMKVALPGAAPAPVAPKLAKWELTSSSSLNFNNTIVNNYANPDITLSLKNSGEAVGSVALSAPTGTNSSYFQINSSNCANIAVNSTCNITASFKPLTSGAANSSVAVTNGPALNFSGTGIAGATDPYFASVSLLMHMDGLGDAFTDVKGGSVTRTGTITTVASPAKFGRASYGDGSVTYLTVAGAAIPGDVTIEAWVYFKDLSSDQDIIGNYTANTAADWTLMMNSSSIQFYPHSAATFIKSSTIVPGTWYHVAATRYGSTCHLFLNGVETGTPIACAGTLADSKAIHIGSRGSIGNYLRGYIDDVRMTKVARYTGSFAVPTAPHPDQ